MIAARRACSSSAHRIFKQQLQQHVQHQCQLWSTLARPFSADSTDSSRSDRLAGIDKPSVWHEFNALAKEHKAVDLGQGFPQWEMPDFVKDLAVKAVNDGCNKHSPKPQPSLVEAVARKYSPELAREIDPTSEVAVTAGAAGAMFNCMQAFIEPGDEVIIIEPFFETYPAIVHMAGGVAKFVPIRPWEPSDGPGPPGSRSSALYMNFDPDELEAAIPDKTRALILNSPHNPTGKVFYHSDLEAIATVLLRHPQVLVFSDEVFESIQFTGLSLPRFAAIHDMWERTVTISSAAKTFSAAGWKVGWCVGPQSLISRIKLVNQRVQFCTEGISTPAQVAIAGALDAALQLYDGGNYANYYTYLITHYTVQRDLLSAGLCEANLSVVEPDGTFFMLVDTRSIDVDQCWLDEVMEEFSAPRDWAMAYYLMEEIGVAGIPLSRFLSAPNRELYQHYVRFAFWQDESTLADATWRLQEHLPGKL